MHALAGYVAATWIVETVFLSPKDCNILFYVAVRIYVLKLMEILSVLLEIVDYIYKLFWNL